jgi:hypothetical protein
MYKQLKAIGTHLRIHPALACGFLFVAYSASAASPLLAVQQDETLRKEQSAPTERLMQGKIQEIAKAGAYTYLRLDVGGEEIWAAGPLPDGLEVGSVVIAPAGTEMTDFESRALGRSFSRLFLIAWARQLAAPGNGDPPPNKTSASALASRVPMKRIDAPRHGLSIKEICDRRTELDGTKVKLRAVVVKVSRGIEGKNWAHLQDGTGNEDHYDLVITTDKDLEVGEFVEVEGVLSVDARTDVGYRYSVLLHDPSVSAMK